MMLETLRRFLRVWLLWSMAAATALTVLAMFDTPLAFGREYVQAMLGLFLVATMIAAVPVLAVMAIKWIIFG